MDPKAKCNELDQDEISWSQFGRMVHQNIQEDEGDTPTTTLISTVLLSNAIHHLLQRESCEPNSIEAVKLIFLAITSQDEPILISINKFRNIIHMINTEDDKVLLLRRLQLQIMIRMKLYSIFSSTKELESAFLGSYADSFISKQRKKVCISLCSEGV
jgi:hypothetical protein